MRRGRCCAIAAGLMLLTLQAAWADGTYQVQLLVRRGDRIGQWQIKADGTFLVGALNGRGQILFLADSADGNQMLVQYDARRLIPIAAAGGEAAGRRWGEALTIRLPIRMNEGGNAAFAADERVGNKSEAGAFFWDAEANRVQPIPVPALLAGHDLAMDPRGLILPALNNRDDLAVAVTVRPAGKPGPSRAGIFLVPENGEALPVALPDGLLPGGSKIAWATYPYLNDAGQVAFLGLPQGGSLSVPYLWEQGIIRDPTVREVSPPRGLLSLGSDKVWVNNANQDMLLTVVLHSLSLHAEALYRVSGGAAVPVVVPGQEMPGGGRFQTLLDNGVSAPDETGQHAFLARLQDGATAAYRMAAGGQLSLILKSGTTTSLGKVVSIGRGYGYLHGVGLNRQGEVALTVQFDRGTETLVLLTPAVPVVQSP